LVPAGRAFEIAVTAETVVTVVTVPTFQVPLWVAATVPLTGCVACQKVPETGWVTPDPSTLSAVIEAMPWTEITSAEALPAVPSAGCLAAVAAPVGSGSEAADTGCVVCQKVPVTATGAATLTGCVACQNVPVTATLAARLTGCVVVPVGSTRNGWAEVPCWFVPSVTSTGSGFA